MDNTYTTTSAILLVVLAGCASSPTTQEGTGCPEIDTLPGTYVYLHVRFDNAAAFGADVFVRQENATYHETTDQLGCALLAGAPGTWQVTVISGGHARQINVQVPQDGFIERTVDFDAKHQPT